VIWRPREFYVRGLTLETVSRALSQLHSQGVLGFSGARQIVLRNRQRLRTMGA
jgi:CRP/FNR family transcriptional regulator, nitrogen fixation regulation protein